MPAPRNYKAVRRVGSTYTELPNVLQLSVDLGKRSILDVPQPGVASFTYRRINSSTAIPAIDDRIYLVDYVTGSTAQQIAQNNKLLFVGRVRDASIDWDINSAGDTVTVECEGQMSMLGRNVLNNYNFPHDNLSVYIAALATASSTTLAVFNAGSDEELHSQTSYSGSCADLLRKIAVSVYGRIVELDDAAALLAKNYVQTATWTFSDNPSGSDQRYDSIRYDSLADNYYTEIENDYPGATVIVGSGTRTLVLDTLSRNSTNATAMANYYKNTFSTPVMGMAEISAKASAQTTFNLSQISTLGSYQGGIYNCVGTQMPVVFRGSTITVIVEGLSISAGPDDSRYTFYVSPADLNSYLVLNNTTLGRLDFNKLGF